MVDSMTIPTACQFCGKAHSPSVGCHTVPPEPPPFTNDLTWQQQIRIEALRAAVRLVASSDFEKWDKNAPSPSQATIVIAEHFVYWIERGS